MVCIMSSGNTIINLKPIVVVNHFVSQSGIDPITAGWYWALTHSCVSGTHHKFLWSNWTSSFFAQFNRLIFCLFSLDLFSFKNKPDCAFSTDLTVFTCIETASLKSVPNTRWLPHPSAPYPSHMWTLKSGYWLSTRAHTNNRSYPFTLQSAISVEFALKHNARQHFTLNQALLIKCVFTMTNA